MVSVMLSRLIVLTAGTLYPAYRSYKAVRTKDVREYVKWMMYWIVFALFCFFETIADILLAFWFPFYYQLKIVFVIWLLSPWTKGASILYRKWVHPTLSRHERDIDAMLDQAKSESYNQMVRLGSRGMLYARDIVATAALRGQAQLVQQLQKSYSMSDVSTNADGTSTLAGPRITEIVEDDEEFGTDGGPEVPQRRVQRRNVAKPVDPHEPEFNTVPRRTTPRRSAGPEVFQQAED